MPQEIGSSLPLRVAIIGAGPAGFYTAERLYKEKDLNVAVDMFDRLPTPFGLVRAGVAPDHQKIKSVTKVFDRVAQKPNFRFFGNIELGKDISVADLRRYYHQIVYTVGAQSDRNLPIPGIDLEGSHAATEFVAWYNGHPDFRDRQFDLEQESVAIIGMGNVAIDVARILSRRPESLGKTDIADHALEALRRSKVKTIYILGRRGPAQAAFTPVEAKELRDMAVTETIVLEEEAELDPLSEASLANADRGTMRNVEIIRQIADHPDEDKPKKLYIRFLVSPAELLGDENGRVRAMKLVKNELYQTESGTLRPRATEQFEEIPVGLVFRSIGYRGVPIEGVPFNDRWGVIANVNGRVVHAETEEIILGEYTAGWIKRGPSGVIGTNKPDSAATVKLMLEDMAIGQLLSPSNPSPDDVLTFIHSQQPRYVTYADWQEIDAAEQAAGAVNGRPRIKFASVEEMLAVVGK